MSSMIQPISGMTSAAAQPSAAISKGKNVQQPEDTSTSRSRKPVMDEYVPEKKQEETGRCTCSTDQVDREIESLKKKQEALKQQLNTQTDGVKIRELEQKLAQIESELSQKDNDAYRRQHAVFS